VTRFSTATLPLIVGAGWLLPFENRLVFFGARPESRTLTATPADYGLPYRRLTLSAEDGVKLMAWELPNTSHAPWVVYFHGNGENVSSYLAATAQLYALGMNVLMLEYRGYGESEGVPSEAGLYRDARASYDHLLHRGVPPKRIALYGFSLGSGVAVHLASEVKVGALVVEAGYTSLPDVARAVYRVVPKGLMTNRFASLEKLPNVKAPALFMHSKGDLTVPYAQGRRLYEAAGEPKAFLELKGGHVGLLNAVNVGVWRDIGDFLSRHL